jgi:aerobic carbon-monoxide dehydrogenase small subunit
MTDRQLITLRVNGKPYELVIEPRRTLADTLRQDLGLTGTHVGCEHGICGACTVLMDGAPVRACLMFAVQADGYEITTIEGLSPAPGELSIVQDAFCETHGLQCGYCTPGMILTAHALLAHNDAPTREDIVEAISGNICRCTGYGQIVEAVEFAADRLRKTNAPRHPEIVVADEPVRLAKSKAPQQGVLEAAQTDAPRGGRP